MDKQSVFCPVYIVDYRTHAPVHGSNDQFVRFLQPVVEGGESKVCVILCGVSAAHTEETQTHTRTHTGGRSTQGCERDAAQNSDAMGCLSEAATRIQCRHEHKARATCVCVCVCVCVFVVTYLMCASALSVRRCSTSRGVSMSTVK